MLSLDQIRSQGVSLPMCQDAYLLSKIILASVQKRLAGYMWVMG